MKGFDRKVFYAGEYCKITLYFILQSYGHTFPTLRKSRYAKIKYFKADIDNKGIISRQNQVAKKNKMLARRICKSLIKNI